MSNIQGEGEGEVEKKEKTHIRAHGFSSRKSLIGRTRVFIRTLPLRRLFKSNKVDPTSSNGSKILWMSVLNLSNM